jgi:hypothetical protein
MCWLPTSAGYTWTAREASIISGHFFPCAPTFGGIASIFSTRTDGPYSQRDSQYSEYGLPNWFGTIILAGMISKNVQHGFTAGSPGARMA